MKDLVNVGLEKTKGGGGRVINKLLRKKYTGLSQPTILKELENNPTNKLMKLKFTNKAPIRPIVSTSVMDRIQIDLVDRSKSPSTVNGKTYRYILSVIDNFSRYV